MQAYLKLDHIDKSFTRGNATTEVLKEINLTIDKGEYVSIIGHSGCGKSTLLNIVAGLTDCHQRLRAAGEPRGQFAGTGSRGGVPEPQPAALADGL